MTTDAAEAPSPLLPRYSATSLRGKPCRLPPATSLCLLFAGATPRHHVCMCSTVPYLFRASSSRMSDVVVCTPHHACCCSSAIAPHDTAGQAHRSAPASARGQRTRLRRAAWRHRRQGCVCKRDKLPTRRRHKANRSLMLIPILRFCARTASAPARHDETSSPSQHRLFGSSGLCSCSSVLQDRPASQPSPSRQTRFLNGRAEIWLCGTTHLRIRNRLYESYSHYCT